MTLSLTRTVAGFSLQLYPQRENKGGRKGDMTRLPGDVGGSRGPDSDTETRGYELAQLWSTDIGASRRAWAIMRQVHLISLVMFFFEPLNLRLGLRKRSPDVSVQLRFHRINLRVYYVVLGRSYQEDKTHNSIRR